MSAGTGGPLLVSAVLLTIAVTASLLFVSGGDQSENAAGNPSQAVPELRFAVADGETMSLSSFRGRVVLRTSGQRGALPAGRKCRRWTA